MFSYYSVVLNYDYYMGFGNKCQKEYRDFLSFYKITDLQVLNDGRDR